MYSPGNWTYTDDTVDCSRRRLPDAVVTDEVTAISIHANSIAVTLNVKTQDDLTVPARPTPPAGRASRNSSESEWR
jgi:hypothetical protein